VRLLLHVGLQQDHARVPQAIVLEPRTYFQPVLVPRTLFIFHPDLENFRNVEAVQ